MTSQAQDNFVWTNDMVKILKDGWKRGDSKSKIAADVGHDITKNAVGGKAWRLKLGNHPTYCGEASGMRHFVHVARTVKRSEPLDGNKGKMTHKPSMPFIPPSRSAY